jgi:hypothetical protein
MQTLYYSLRPQNDAFSFFELQSKISIIKLIIKYFIVNLVRDININTIYYKFN